MKTAKVNSESICSSWILLCSEVIFQIKWVIILVLFLYKLRSVLVRKSTTSGIVTSPIPTHKMLNIFHPSPWL